jgi:hypothetical protein
MVDKEMRRDARGHRYLPRLPRSVSHEFLDYWTQEIGLSPIPGTQGRLAHIIVYGSVNNPPVYDHTAALRRETPAILEMFADEAEEDTLGSRRVGSFRDDAGRLRDASTGRFMSEAATV